VTALSYGFLDRCGSAVKAGQELGLELLEVRRRGAQRMQEIEQAVVAVTAGVVTW
jgi:hypothetical protein